MKNIKALLILLLLSVSVFPQADKNGGSLYSIFGLGELTYSASTRTDGMGIMGIGLYGNYSNTFNPAAWTKIQSTIFTTKFNFDRIVSTDGTNEAKRVYGNFESFNLAIPLNKGNGWIFSLGLDNYSNVNYDTKFSSSIENENYTQTYSGNGGLNRLNLGFSYIIFKNFSIGAQFNYTFGNINRILNIDFTNPLLFDTKNRTENQINGFYFNTGLIFHGFDKLFKSKKLKDMTLGVYFSTPSKFNSSINGRYSRTITQIDSVAINDGKIDIPWSFGVGFSNIFNNRLTVAADLFMQNWDNYKYYGSHPLEIKNSMRLGAGIEFTDSKKPEDSYFKRVSLRFGGFYQAEYLRINNEPINTFGLSAGLSLPIGYLNAVDLLFQYYTRGKTTNGLIRDNVIKFGASIKIGELWFLKPSEDF
ncbi:MAG TPA: hypothetical protein VJ455_02550 [Ignavibacteria bacterium]|nr:hypothetical protein [Ignavibacteria bacterium]